MPCCPLRDAWKPGGGVLVWRCIMDMSQKLMRSRSERIIAGVAGGIANYLLIDPVIIRLAFVLLLFSGGIGLLFYPVLWVVMPREPVMMPLPMQQPGTLPPDGSAGGDEVYYVKTSSQMADVRFDPLSGAPLRVTEYSPGEEQQREQRYAVDTQLQRNWVMGIILVALGGYFLLQATFLAPFIVPALLITGGLILILRNRGS